MGTTKTDNQVVDLSIFEKFPAISRLSREMIITEKLDGTNACVCITQDDKFLIGSRKRWIVPGDDNFGFATWATKNEEELRQLGQGVHHGEWWGQGIGRRYGLDEKRFSLFNTGRWHDLKRVIPAEGSTLVPECCHVVPVLYIGTFDTHAIDVVMEALKNAGSRAAPGFMKPEGIVIFHTALYSSFKKTFEHDDMSKWQIANQ